ncbi:hypothetical protein ACFWUQ_09260 [Streptomyces sp. NPDC058662]|uniref:hypothetical protein n=1 Tax=Streptomyces sp. NPDC058662 TaxID=3346583 RepID=UPI003667A5EB
MRSVLIALRATGVAVALTALSAVTAPTALAGEEDRGRVTVDPNPAHPGAQVKLRVHGCGGTRGAAKSSVFVADADLYGRDGGRSPLHGDAMVRSHASPGRHSVRVFCDGHEKISGSIEIAHYRPSHHPSPVWPVHAGGGGMSAEITEKSELAAAERKDQEGGGPSLPHTVIGAVLAAAATLAVAGRALALRRRRSGG